MYVRHINTRTMTKYKSKKYNDKPSKKDVRWCHLKYNDGESMFRADWVVSVNYKSEIKIIYIDFIGDNQWALQDVGAHDYENIKNLIKTALK